jgi:hypothetical protein
MVSSSFLICAQNETVRAPRSTSLVALRPFGEDGNPRDQGLTREERKVAD